MSKNQGRGVSSVYRKLYFFITLFILTYLIFKLVQSYAVSLFRHDADRINVVIYGPEMAFYSLDKRDARHYVMYFYPDLKMEVPGGYGDYRVGSLGKLAHLDKQPDILRKTFAFATTSFVQLYFYPATDDVYYGDDFKKKPVKPSLRDIMLMSSNATILDRVYLFLFLIDKKDDDFHQIAYQSEVNKIHNDVFFEDKSFVKNSIGLLFQKSYRDEQKNIQLLYRENFAVAQKIGTLLEGNGIRVNDLSLDLARRNRCMVIESATGEEFSLTARDISAYFNCTLEKGKTDVYDILFVLGSVEDEWEL